MEHFAFESLQQLLHMDGHGPYVWTAYGISAATLLVLVYQGRAQRRQRIQEIKMLKRREQR